MKKTVKVLTLVVVSLGMMSIFMGCDNEILQESKHVQTQLMTKESKISLPEEFSEYGLKSYPKGIITFEEFKETGKMLTREEAQQLIQEKKMGENPDNAIVWLIFHANGVLYTPHEFNFSGIKEDLLSGNDVHQWVVNLKTFQEVTGLKEATGEYARNFGNYWVFDPDVKFYETRAEKEALGQKKQPHKIKAYSPASDSYQNYLKKGNILYGEWQWWSPAGYTGHTAGIMNSPRFGPASYSGDYSLKKVIVVEAMPISGVVEHCPIYTSSSVSDWSSSNMTRRCVVFTTIAPSEVQRNSIQEFQENQLGKNWWFPTTSLEAHANKEQIGSFYCSKLQWLAYKTVMGLDLDRDGGAWVFPRDILYDDDVRYIQFWYWILT